MRRFWFWFALAICVAGCSRPPQTYTVVIESMKYTPAALTVKAGDSVVWINKDLFPHTVTSAATGLESHDIASNASWTYVAHLKGNVAYACRYHPTMTGALTVE